MDLAKLDKVIKVLGPATAIGMEGVYVGEIPDEYAAILLGGLFQGNETREAAQPDDKEEEDMRVLIVPVALASPGSATGTNVGTVVTKLRTDATQYADTESLRDRGMTGHVMMGAVYQRNPDGSVRINPDSKQPIFALDENGNPMLGPIMFSWSDNAVAVKQPYLAGGLESEAPPLTTLAGSGEQVYVGGFVATGGGGGGGEVFANTFFQSWLENFCGTTDEDDV